MAVDHDWTLVLQWLDECAENSRSPTRGTRAAELITAATGVMRDRRQTHTIDGKNLLYV